MYVYMIETCIMKRLASDFEKITNLYARIGGGAKNVFDILQVLITDEESYWMF